MVDLNCDMGEGFGIYSFAEDEEIMPFIDAANVACGFHASDPNIMRKTVELAKKYIRQIYESKVDCIEIGYRSLKNDNYYGPFYYCSEDFLNSPKVYKPKALISTLSKAIFSIKAAFSSLFKFLSDNLLIASLTSSVTNSLGLVL